MTNFNDKFMKIVFVGNSDVGKTTLVKRYANDVFGDFGPTIGLSHVTKEIIVDDKSIQMHMWDTAGQERYRSLVRAYYRRSHGCVIVFDVTNSSSFEGVKYWMEDILKKKMIRQKYSLLVINLISLTDKWNIMKDMNMQNQKDVHIWKHLHYLEKV